MEFKLSTQWEDISLWVCHQHLFIVLLTNLLKGACKLTCPGKSSLIIPLCTTRVESDGKVLLDVVASTLLSQALLPFSVE